MGDMRNLEKEMNEESLIKTTTNVDMPSQL